MLHCTLEQRYQYLWTQKRWSGVEEGPASLDRDMILPCFPFMWAQKVTQKLKNSAFGSKNEIKAFRIVL